MRKERPRRIDSSFLDGSCRNFGEHSQPNSHRRVRANAKWRTTRPAISEAARLPKRRSNKGGSLEREHFYRPIPRIRARTQVSAFEAPRLALLHDDQNRDGGRRPGHRARA